MFFPDGEDKSLKKLLRLIRGAKKSVHVCLYLVSNAQLKAAILEKHKENVEVLVFMGTG